MIGMPETYLTFDGSKYKNNGSHFDRVSEVIRRMTREPAYQLEAWKKRVGEEMAEIIGRKTSEVGTLIHQVTALHDLKQWKERDRLIEEEPRLIPYWLFWEEWVEEYVEEIIEVEVVVFDVKHGIAGTIDRILRMRGDKKPALGDIKTGGTGYDKIGVQVRGAYRTMWNETHKKAQQVDRTIVISMPRWKIEEEIEMGKEQTELRRLTIKEVEGEKWEKEWKRMREEWSMSR